MRASDDTHNGTQLGGCTGRGFMPGQSGNPAGRPKGPSLTRLLREALDADDGAAADAIVQRIIASAKGGNFKYIKLIFDRIDGPVQARQGAAEPDTVLTAELTDNDLVRIAHFAVSDAGNA